MPAVLADQENMVRTLAVIDDDPNVAEMTSWQVEEAGFKPVLITGTYSQPEELAAAITAVAQGAICDHRLSTRGFASFYGARVVSDLFSQQHIPAILITQFMDMDEDVSIRKWRRSVPVLLSRDEANSDSIRSGINACLSEIRGNIPSTRKPFRTVIQVVSLGNESGEDVADVLVPSWNTRRAVRLPLDLIPPRVREQVTDGTFLFADVNIGAKQHQDLFFTDFELAPPPHDDDGLAGTDHS